MKRRYVLALAGLTALPLQARALPGILLPGTTACTARTCLPCLKGRGNHLPRITSRTARKMIAPPLTAMTRIRAAGTINMASPSLVPLLTRKQSRLDTNVLFLRRVAPGASLCCVYRRLSNVDVQGSVANFDLRPLYFNGERAEPVLT